MAQIILAADTGRARIFRLQVGEGPELQETFHVVEVSDMVNPEQRLSDSELFTEPRPGIRREGKGQRGQMTSHGVSDHREQHRQEFNRQFAVDIMEAVMQATEGDKINGLLVAAGPKMLGELRHHFKKLEQEGFEIKDLAKDLIQKSPSELHDYLAEQDLIPPRSRLGQS